MTDPLISDNLPILNGYIAKHYGWLQYRGNCLVTVEDLQQLAAITLVRLTAAYDDYLESINLSRRTAGPGMFWSLLKTNVKQDLLKYYEREGQADDFGLDQSIDERWEVGRDGEEDTDPRTSLKAVEEAPEWGVIRDVILDAFAMMPRRHKVVIGLLRFDALEQKQAADLLGVGQSAVSLTLTAAREYLLTVARNQFSEYPIDVSPFKGTRWEVPASLTEYLTTRHRMDLDEYLGIVTLAFKSDPIYLVQMLGGYDAAGKSRGSWSLTADQMSRVDYLEGQGISLKAIADVIGVPYHQVYRYSRAEERRAYKRRYRAAGGNS